MSKKVIDFDALNKNLESFNGKRLCAMVKANAYGLGIENIAPFLKDKVEYFGVSSIAEALKLRALVDNKILIVCPVKDYDACKKHNFEFIVDNLDDLKLVKSKKLTKLMHIKISSGMNRYGFDYSNIRLIKMLRLELKDCQIAGICTHFSNLADKEVTKKEYLRFNKIKKFLNKDAVISLGGGEVINYPFNYDLLRIGLGLYYKKADVLSVSSKICEIRNIKKGETVGYLNKFKASKDLTIAVCRIGYADGLFKCYSGAKVFVMNQPAKIIGPICMDACFIDITGLNVSEGDEVIFKVEELRRASKLSRYEILTGLNNLRED